MPWKPKVPCKHPGCPALIEPGKMYCEKHQKKADSDYNRYYRNPVHKARYHNARWKAIRAAQLERQPLCEECMKQGRYTKATIAHHRLPVEEGGTDDFDNLESLCGSCHSRIHAQRGDRWHNRKRAGSPTENEGGNDNVQ